MSAAQPAQQASSHYPMQTGNDEKSWRTLAMMVQDESGAVLRVANLFSSRGYNIQSIAASVVDEEKGLACISVVVYGCDRIVDQIKKELERLIFTYRVVDLTRNSHGVELELALIKFKAHQATHTEILSLTNAFDARVIESNEDIYIIKLSAPPGKINAFIDIARPLGIVEIVRSGAIGLINEAAALADIEKSVKAA